MTHICVSKLTIIASDNGLLPDRRQIITWTNAGISLIRPLETNFSEILIKIHTFSFKKIHLKMSPGKWRPFCLGLNVLNLLWSSDAIYHQRALSSLIQVMDWCPIATRRYLNQYCWIIINEVFWQFWHSPESRGQNDSECSRYLSLIWVK